MVKQGEGLMKVPWLLLIGIVTGSLCLPCASHANTWDLKLGRLCWIMTKGDNLFPCGGSYTAAAEGADPIQQVVPDDPAFRSLMSEVGVIFAPSTLSTAETRGYNGFSFAAEFGWTMANPKNTSASFNVISAGG